MCEGADLADRNSFEIWVIDDTSGFVFKLEISNFVSLRSFKRGHLAPT